MSIGLAIKTVREKRSLSQTELAKRVRVTQAFLSYIEKGSREPSFELIDQISKELEVPQQVLLLLACDKRSKAGRYSKYLHNIASALDDVLRNLGPAQA